MGTATSNIAKNTQNNKVQTKDEEQRRRLNRQINFLIMRDAWQIVRRHEYGDAFEDALSSSRTRVSKAIDGKNIVPQLII